MKNLIECKNYCDDSWSFGSGEEFQIKSPKNNQTLGKAKCTTESDLNLIVQSAQAAQKSWADTPIKERSQVMFKFRELLLRDIAKLAEQISNECGKTISEAEAEIHKGVEVVEFALSIQNLDSGGKVEVSRGVFCEYRREPLGIVAAITPFNFPAMVPLWMIPIALSLGNALIWKPSDKTPLTSILIANLLKEAGLPKGLFSIAHGLRDTVQHILKHPSIGAIGFVGSTAVAKEIYTVGSANFKRVLALGGAKNHILLMPDADPHLAARGIADSFTGCAGQRCMAASVLCAIAKNDAESKKIDLLLASIVETARQIHATKNMGAIINNISLKRLHAAIEQAATEGGKILLDGRSPIVPKDLADGNWLNPTIIDHVKPGNYAATEELFGPVLSIIRCRSIEEALHIQNQSVYGNAVSVFTQDGGIADQVAKLGKAGMVGINIGVPVPREPFSFGGTYESKFGHGDITGIHSLNFWSNIKKVTTKWAAQKDTTWMG